MKTVELIAPCHFGMEAVLKREILDLGYEISRVEDGKVTFWGDMEAVCYGNIFLRTAERILLQVGRIHAETYDELFEETRKLPWEEYIPEDGKFWVTKATTIKSKLFSAPDIQSVMKKAMVERMKSRYKREWFPEEGNAYPVRVTLLKDEAVIGLDTTGIPLHKRGYRQLTAKAPISETLAAALIMLTPWRGNRILADPFCGSGTIPIEAAMMAADMAPGMNRSFLAEEWTNLISRKHWYGAMDEARDRLNRQVQTDIQGFDIDGRAIRMAKENARMAGVGRLVRFQERPVSQFSHPGEYGFIITNPPYGERIEEKEALPGLYREIGQSFERVPTWSKYLITSYENAERDIGKRADKNRKIYNGMLKTYYYQYLGPKPEKAKNREQ